MTFEIAARCFSNTKNVHNTPETDTQTLKINEL